MHPPNITGMMFYLMRILRKIFKTLLLLLAFIYAGLVVYAYWPSEIEELPARLLAGPNDQFIAVNEMELRYQSFGSPGPDKPNLVLIHGFGNSLQSFRLLAPLLADDFYVVTFDLPGFGLSSKPADYDYRAASQAKTIGDFVRAMGLKQVIIGGHSLGGALALRVAVNEPEVIGLVLMNPGIINTGVPAITQYLKFPFPRLSAKQFSDREFRKNFLKMSFIDESVVTEAVIDDLMLASRSEGYLEGNTRMMGQYESASEVALLGSVTVPTVIVWGAKDRNKTPEELAELERGIPDSTTVVAPEAGHFVHEEAPRESADGLIRAIPLWTGSRTTQTDSD
jgi:magnesium chelatase accessory protein